MSCVFLFRLLELEGGSGQVEPDGPVVLVEEPERFAMGRTWYIKCEILYCILPRGSAADYIEPRLREEEVARVKPQERQVVVEPDEPVALVEEPEHQPRFAMGCKLRAKYYHTISYPGDQLLRT